VEWTLLILRKHWRAALCFSGWIASLILADHVKSLARLRKGHRKLLLEPSTAPVFTIANGFGIEKHLDRLIAARAPEHQTGFSAR